MITLVRTPVEQLELASTPSAGPAHVQRATVQRYGPDGIALAERVSLDYTGASFDDDGNLVGGLVATQAVFQGVTCNQGSVRFGASGATAATTTVYDRRIGGVHRVVASDSSGLSYQWGRLVAGTLATVSTRADGSLASKGSLVWHAEQLATADFELYATDGSGTLARRTALDFAAAERIGDEIIGGRIGTKCWRANGTLVSEGSTTFGPTGLPISFSQTAYSGADAGIASHVTVDYAGITFDALKQIASGELTITVKRANGTKASVATVSYSAGVPTAYSAARYDTHGTLVRHVAMSYAGVTFNQELRPVNSSITAVITAADGTRISSVVTQYGSHGNPVRQEISTRGAGTGGSDVVTRVDYRHAVYDARHVVIGGRTTSATDANGLRVEVRRSFAGDRRAVTKERRVTRLSDGHLKSWSKTYYRPDGTASKLVKVASDASGHPVEGKVLYFGTDGKTIVSKRQIDYRGVTWDGRTLAGGDVGMTIRDGRGRARARTTVSFG